MANLFDYLAWRGELTFAQSPLNDVDALILTCLSYHIYHEVLHPYDEKVVTVAQAAKEVKALEEQKLLVRDTRDLVLLQVAAMSKRFQDIGLCFYVDYINQKQEAQFAAVTALLPDGSAFVSFRGTDLSLVGWKEDFNMTFREIIPAQIGAAAYLSMIGEKISGPIFVGGHSKGGNLSVFAASLVKRCIQERIVSVYNFDGPGFHEEVLKCMGYQTILQRVQTIVPQSSIVGLLLNHQSELRVVRSKEIGILQHDPYSWEVKGNAFVLVEAVSSGSQFLDKTLKNWLKSLSLERREKFADALFELLHATHANEEGEVVLSAQNAYRSLHALKDEDEETKEAIFGALHLLWCAAKHTAEESGGLPWQREKTKASSVKKNEEESW